MRRLAPLALLVIAGCQRPAMPVYVDLSHVLPAPPAMRLSPRLQASAPALPASSGTLRALAGAELNMSQTAGRIGEARKLIAINKEEALRGLTRALYRSYKLEAEADKNLRERDVEILAETMWDRAFEQISSELKGYAKERFPNVNRLALLAGFPTESPSLRERPPNPRDAKPYDEAVRLWNELVQIDKEFAALAQRILDQVREQISHRQVDVQVDYSKALSAASERSAREAQAAVASRLPDFTGALSQRPDLRLPAVPQETVQLAGVSVPPAATISPSEPLDLRREFLEQDLRIWLAQNGYTLAAGPQFAPDRTKEFAAWIKKRRPGL